MRLGYGNLLQNGKRCVVVRLVLDFRNQLGVQHLVAFVENDDGAGGQAGERTISDGDAVVLGEVGIAEAGQGEHVLDAFGGAEAALGKRQVARDHQHLGVVQGSGGFVELAGGGGAGRGVEAGHDVQDLALAFEGGQGLVLEATGNQIEIGGGGADLGQVAGDGNGIAAKSYGGHISLLVGLG